MSIFIRKVARPSEEALRTLWPDDSDRPPRKRAEGPIKTDAQREHDAREKLSNPLHPTTSVNVGDARRKFPDGTRWPAKHKLTGPTPREDGTYSVAFHGGASRAVPATWGSGYTSRYGREYLAERVGKDGQKEVKSLAKPVMRYARMDPTGESARLVPCSEKQAEVSFHVGWKGGAEKISTKQGDRIVYAASDKLPCRGSGESVKIVRDTEERTGKKGAFTVETFRATCPGCKQVRNVPHKVAKADPRPSTWVFPDHASPAGATRNMVVDPSCDNVRPVFAPMSDVERESFRPGTFFALAEIASKGGLNDNAGTERGLRKMLEVYRLYPTIGSVAYVEAPRATRASVKGATVKIPTASFGRSVRDAVGVTEIEAARVKREAKPIILCDARKAPVRNIVAF